MGRVLDRKNNEPAEKVWDLGVGGIKGEGGPEASWTEMWRMLQITSSGGWKTNNNNILSELSFILCKLGCT